MRSGDSSLAEKKVFGYRKIRSEPTLAVCSGEGRVARVGG